MAVSHLTSPAKDYGINGFLPKGTLQLFRFLLAFPIDRPNGLLSFSGFSLEKFIKSEARRTTQRRTDKESVTEH